MIRINGAAVIRLAMASLRVTQELEPLGQAVVDAPNERVKEKAIRALMAEWDRLSNASPVQRAARKSKPKSRKASR
jgi:hypothetical protein